MVSESRDDKNENNGEIEWSFNEFVEAFDDEEAGNEGEEIDESDEDKENNGDGGCLSGHVSGDVMTIWD